MKLDIKVEDNRHLIDFWITLFQSGYSITDREKSVLIEILLRRYELSKSGIGEPFLTKLLFDVDSRKIYTEALSISTYTLTNVLSSLRSKGVIDESNTILDVLIPEDKLEFEFKR